MAFVGAPPRRDYYVLIQDLKNRAEAALLQKHL